MSKKISYRAVPIEKFTSAALAAALVGLTRLVVAIDVAKVKMMAGFGGEGGDIARLVRFESPRETLAFCPSDWTGGSSLVDYHTNTIAGVWQSRQYDALRRAHLTNDFRAHAFCGQCPDWQETRWPGEGRTYATLVAGLKEVAA